MRVCVAPKKNKQEENKKCGVDVLVSFRGVALRYLLEVTIATAQLHTHTHTHNHTEKKGIEEKNRKISL
jgi:hypothetical protein